MDIRSATRTPTESSAGEEGIQRFGGDAVFGRPV
jgi:hypothetical protein